ncbi:MAG: hypothetical protein K8I30_03920, partial [Anaerolineae bacterium]|nr:hypothetical protein [Anaerolineae bacterium]
MLVSRRVLVLSLVVVFGIGALIGGVAGVFIFIQIAGGSGEPSAPISAPTLSLKTLENTATPSQSDGALPAIATQVAYIANQVEALSTAAANDKLVTQVAGLNTQFQSFFAAGGIDTRLLAQAGTPTRTPRPTRTPTPTAT